MVKNLPVMQETWVQSLGKEDSLEKANHSSIPAWEIPWTEEAGGLWSVGSQSVGHDWATNTSPADGHMAGARFCLLPSSLSVLEARTVAR